MCTKLRIQDMEGYLYVGGFIPSCVCYWGERQRKGTSLFNLCLRICIALNRGVNHCLWGHSYSESSWIWRWTCWCPSVLMLVTPLFIVVLSVSIQLEYSWPRCISLKNGWKGLLGTFSFLPNSLLNWSSISDKSPSTSIFAWGFFVFFLEMCFISLLTCLSHAFLPANSRAVRRPIYLFHLCIQRLVVGLNIRTYYKQLKPTDTEERQTRRER